MITGVKISEKATMWKCPKCGREFKKKEQSHYCGEKQTGSVCTGK